MKILQWLLLYSKNNFNLGISLVVLWLRLPAPNAWGLRLILGQGSDLICHNQDPAQSNKLKKKKKKNFSLISYIFLSIMSPKRKEIQFIYINLV